MFYTFQRYRVKYLYTTLTSKNRKNIHKIKNTFHLIWRCFSTIDNRFRIHFQFLSSSSFLLSISLYILPKILLCSHFLGFSAYLSIYLFIYLGHSISFQTFFTQAFKIVVDYWKFSMLLQYILWDDWPIFIISDSNEQLQQELEYTLLKPDCHCWWISKIQSGL